MSGSARRAVAFDCFGTLLSVDRPADPAAAVADALADRGVPAPADWSRAYGESHLDVPDGGELPLARHVAAALSSRGVDCPPETARAAVSEAFDRPADRRAGARETVAAVDGPVGVLSNCSVPGLVARALSRAGLADAFDAVVTSVDCGWRKPDPRAFDAAARALSVPVGGLVHVGDDPAADGGGARDAGATPVVVDRDAPLDPTRLPEAVRCR